MHKSMVPSEIRIGARHRKELGDIGTLAESIRLRGLLHPPVITTTGDLVCGYRRLLAVKKLDWLRVDCRVIDPDSMLSAEHDENEIRKDFTPSERVAIAREIEDRLGRRQGQRTGTPISDGELVGHGAQVPRGEKTREFAAKTAGFNGSRQYHRAGKVVDHGAPELVEAMDKGNVSITAAALVAELPAAGQKEVVARGPEAIQKAAVERRAGKSLVNGQLSDDPPEVRRQRERGIIAPDVVPVVTTNPDSEPETPAESPEESDEEGLIDEAWLGRLPARAKIGAACIRRFDADALLYRALEVVRKTFQHHARRALNLSRRHGGSDGQYAYRLSRFLKCDHPRHWLVCPSTEAGGCEGTGNIPMIGECPKCYGRGYWIK